MKKLQDLLLNYECDILKNVFIFDYFKNDKKEEIKIGFRFIFQSPKSTITSAQIEFIYNDIVSKSSKIDGIEIPGI
jgi:phenylalanyl-tRNA synthetase beta subunit